jgi:tetraacyldisaccharide 4'-kinase
MMEIEKSIRAYVTKPVFFSRIRYGTPVAYQSHTLPLGDEVALITGVSNPAPLEDYLTQSVKLVKHFKFGDHHDYSLSDVQKFVRFRSEHPTASLITTEKDMVKLADPEFQSLLEGLSLFYLPIELEFIKSGRDFDALVLNSIRREG